MITIHKSKLGITLVAVYLLLIAYAIIELNMGPPEPMSEFGLLILSAPWSFILLEILETGGLVSQKNNSLLLYALVVSGGAINSTIVYFIGVLFSKLISLMGKSRLE